MAGIVRFGVSLSREILAKFDGLTKKQNYSTRSKAIEDLIRKALMEDIVSKGSSEVIGAIDVVYDHHKRELLNKLTDIQHDYQENVVSTQHIHLGHHNCFEIIVVKGKKQVIEALENKIKSAKGVKYSSLRIVAQHED